jgi:hypothetical protein
VTRPQKKRPTPSKTRTAARRPPQRGSSSPIGRGRIRWVIAGLGLIGGLIGVAVSGTDTGPPFLNAIYAPNHHADEAFQRAVVGGVQPHHWNFGPMVPVDGLDRSDVALIIEFVRSQQETAGILRDPSHG